MNTPAPMTDVGAAWLELEGAVVRGETFAEVAAPSAAPCCGTPDDVSIGARTAAAATGAAATSAGKSALGERWTTGADVTLVVLAAAVRSFGPPVLSLVAAAVAGGACVTGAITMVVAGIAWAAAAVVSTIVTWAGSRCAWPRPRHETTIIVPAATAAAPEAIAAQSSFCRRKRTSAVSHRGLVGSTAAFGAPDMPPLIGRGCDVVTLRLLARLD